VVPHVTPDRGAGGVYAPPRPGRADWPLLPLLRGLLGGLLRSFLRHVSSWNVAAQLWALCSRVPTGGL